MTCVLRRVLSLNMILVKEFTPGSSSLGTANGLAQFSQCLARTVAPTFSRYTHICVFIDKSIYFFSPAVFLLFLSIIRCFQETSGLLSCLSSHLYLASTPWYCLRSMVKSNRTTFRQWNMHLLRKLTSKPLYR